MTPKEHIQGSISTKQLLLKDDFFHTALEEAILLISLAMANGNKLMICGNGGSAADAQHIAAEFTSMLDLTLGERPGLPALALTTDTSFITACSNDYAFENIFRRQVQALGNQGDVLLGISTSGNSKNVMLAFEEARDNEISTIALTGNSGGRMADSDDISLDVLLNVPSTKTQWIQEAHIMIGHMICYGVETRVFPPEER
jgi:D-sedoheptulose 7-phosphate isomerase